MCLHTWNFRKISYDFIVYGSGVENRLDGLFTMLNMDEHNHMWNNMESWHMIVQYAIPSATSLDIQMRTYCTVVDNKSIHSHLCTICDAIRCTVFFSAHRYGHIALVDHQIFSLSSNQYIIPTSHWRNHNVTVKCRQG